VASQDLIRAQIEAAWADATPPKGPLTKTYDDEGVGEYFAGKTWRGHDPKALNYHAVALSFFQPEAFIYYLPAFLLAEVDGNGPGGSIVFHLSPSNLNREWGAKYRTTMAGFTPAQRAALVEYLYWYAGNSDGYDDDDCQAIIAYLTTGQEPVVDGATERLLAIHGRPCERATLKQLSLGSSNVTDEDLTALADFPALEDLDVSHTAITSVGLAHIAQRPLEHLDASRCQKIADYTPIGRMSSLQRLKLANSSLSSLDFLAPLQLVELDITHSKAITNFTPLDTSRLESLQMFGVRAPDSLCRRLTKLREIVCSHVSDASLMAMRSLERIRIADLSDATTDGGLGALAALPALTELELPKCRARLPAGFPALTKLTFLESGSGDPLPVLPALVELRIFAIAMPVRCDSIPLQPKLTRVVVHCVELDEHHVDALAGASIRDLDLITGVMTGTSLATVATLPLTSLRLERLDHFDERHLALLASSKLESLELSVPVANLLVLRDIASLRRLVLTTKSDPSALRAARPDLEIIQR
jgi:Leucine-rich repeat (LRR) protein